MHLKDLKLIKFYDLKQFVLLLLNNCLFVHKYKGKSKLLQYFAYFV